MAYWSPKVALSLLCLRFDMQDVRRIRRLLRLQHDLEVNIAGAALAIDLMEQIEELKVQVELLEKLLGSDPAIGCGQ